MKYKKINQEPYCCVPACLQMVLRRNKIPYKTQEEIGYELGLTLPEDYKNIFKKAIYGEIPISGYGTQVQKKEYSINNFFKHNNIPLKEKYCFIDDINKARNFIIKYSNDDIIVCLNAGILYNDSNINFGHAVVIERIIDDEVLLVDPSYNKKYEIIKLERLVNAIKTHGKTKRAGFWLIKKV